MQFFWGGTHFLQSLWRQHKQHCMVQTSRNPSHKKSCGLQKHTAQKFKDTDLQRKKMRSSFSAKPSNSCKSNNGSHFQCRRMRSLLLRRRLDSKFKNPRHLGKPDTLRSPRESSKESKYFFNRIKHSIITGESIRQAGYPDSTIVSAKIHSYIS